MKAVTVAPDAALVAERRRDRLSERDAAIFHGVMRVHGEIAVAVQIQIHRGVLRKERKHVVEERKAGADFGFALAVEVEAEGNLGFERVTLDGGGARFHRGN